MRTKNRPGRTMANPICRGDGLTRSLADRSETGHWVQVLVLTVTVVPVATVTPKSVAPVQLVDVRMAPGAVAVQSRPANWLPTATRVCAPAPVARLTQMPAPMFGLLPTGACKVFRLAFPAAAPVTPRSIPARLLAAGVAPAEAMRMPLPLLARKMLFLTLILLPASLGQKLSPSKELRTGTGLGDQRSAGANDVGEHTEDGLRDFTKHRRESIRHRLPQTSVTPRSSGSARSSCGGQSQILSFHSLATYERIFDFLVFV